MPGLSRPDRAFLQSMIGHHEEAVMMSTGYLKHPGAQRRGDVSGLARKIIAAQTPEIRQMKKWLNAAGASSAGKNDDMGGGMKGMAGGGGMKGM